MPNVSRFTVVPKLPTELARLSDIANNVWWCWDPDAIELFFRMDRSLWEKLDQNPVALLGALSQERLAERHGREAQQGGRDESRDEHRADATGAEDRFEHPPAVERIDRETVQERPDDAHPEEKEEEILDQGLRERRIKEDRQGREPQENLDRGPGRRDQKGLDAVQNPRRVRRIPPEGLQHNLGRLLEIPDRQGVPHLVDQHRYEAGQDKQAEFQELRLGRYPAQRPPKQGQGQPEYGV